MRVALFLVASMLLASIPMTAAAGGSQEDSMWPGDPIDSHVHMTWAAMTLEVNGWADDYPEIVDLISAGESELGRLCGWFDYLIGRLMLRKMAIRKRLYTSMEVTTAMNTLELLTTGFQQMVH